MKGLHIDLELRTANLHGAIQRDHSRGAYWGVGGSSRLTAVDIDITIENFDFPELDVRRTSTNHSGTLGGRAVARPG